MLVTHDRALAERCNRVLELDAGHTVNLMQALRFALRNLWRDLKSGELSVLLLALMVAVLSLTAVGLLHQPHLAGRARAGGGSAGGGSAPGVADPDPGALLRRGARRAALRSAQVVSFPTAIFSGDLSQLAALNAVTANYPLRGHVRIADAPFGARANHRSDSRPRARCGSMRASSRS